jgi:hypothetical protein
MAKNNSMIYGLWVLALIALLLVIYYNREISGFAGAPSIKEQFDGMDDAQKKQICKTLTDQLADIKSKQTSVAPEQAAAYTDAVKGLSDQMSTIGC